MSEKPKRACEGVTLPVKLEMITCLDHAEQNKGIVHLLNVGLGMLKTSSV